MEKTCSGCKETQPIKNFYKDKNRKDGHYVRCRKCQAEYSRNYRKRFPNKSTNSTIKYRYGITLEEYTTKLREQFDCCAICSTAFPGGKKKSFFIDHNHKTNQVRGLLCRECNLMIGHAKDDPDILREAIRYLEEWENKS